ncbi:MAG: hypothetical protein U9N47_08415 [Thermodesulfobacteriota bacterium]|nr:hypothetical protein [Thermodesulfobacteriota bacterium]
MKNIEGNWVGRISGTNVGYAFVEIKQVDQELSGIARINDPIYGTAIYNFTGLIEGAKIILKMRPDESILGDMRSQTILVNNQQVNVKAPSVNYGDVVAEAEIQDDFTISGKWTSTIGTGGTLFLRNDDIVKKEKEKISQYDIKNQAFVMMSISADDTELEDVLNAIKRATKKHDIECKRVDEVHHSGKITDLILEYINISRYLICDISKERPNVYYELGYAHGIGKEVILIAKHGTTMHFDIKDYNTIFYKNMTELENSLSKRISAINERNAQPD